VVDKTPSATIANAIQASPDTIPGVIAADDGDFRTRGMRLGAAAIQAIAGDFIDAAPLRFWLACKGCTPRPNEM
jgi:hypothetical protein